MVSRLQMIGKNLPSGIHWVPSQNTFETRTLKIQKKMQSQTERIKIMSRLSYSKTQSCFQCSNAYICIDSTVNE